MVRFELLFEFTNCLLKEDEEAGAQSIRTERWVEAETGWRGGRPQQVVRLLATYNGRQHVYFLLEAQGSVRQTTIGEPSVLFFMCWEGHQRSQISMQLDLELAAFFIFVSHKLSSAAMICFSCSLHVWHPSYVNTMPLCLVSCPNNQSHLPQAALGGELFTTYERLKLYGASLTSGTRDLQDPVDSICST